MFSYRLFHLELFSTHMTSITLYMCVFMCKKLLKHFHVNCVGNMSRKRREHTNHMQKKHKLIFFIQVKDNRLKGAVYIQIIRCRKYLCAITEAPDAFMIFWILKNISSGILISFTGIQLKCYCFFANVFSSAISS